MAARPARVSFPETILRTVALDAARLVVPAVLPGGVDRPTIPSLTGLAVAGPHGLRATADAETAPVGVCAPIRFTSLTLAWEQERGAPPTAFIVVADRGGAFGRPFEVGDDDAGPDPGSPDARRPSTHATGPLWAAGLPQHVRHGRVPTKMLTFPATRGRRSARPRPKP